MQGGGTSATQHDMEEKMRKLQQMKQQEEEFDKHLAQTVPVSIDTNSLRLQNVISRIARDH